MKTKPYPRLSAFICVHLWRKMRFSCPDHRPNRPRRPGQRPSTHEPGHLCLLRRLQVICLSISPPCLCTTNALNLCTPRGFSPWPPPPPCPPVLPLSCFSQCLIVSPEKKSNIVLGFWILPPTRGVAWVASQRSKHLLPLLLERASRRYEFQCPAQLCLRGAVRAAGCAWFQKRILRRFPFLDFTIRLSPEPSQPLRRGV